MMQSGTDCRSTTPGISLEGRVMYASVPSYSLSAPSSYPSISSPSTLQTSVSPATTQIYINEKYLPNTPPEAHRYNVSEAYRPPIELSNQNRYEAESARVSGDSYRHSSGDTHRVPVDHHRIRMEEVALDSYHNSSTENAYQINNPIDLHRVPEPHSPHLISGQRFISEGQRMNSESQKALEDQRSAISTEQLQRHDIHISHSPNGTNEDCRSSFNTEQSQRILQDSMLRSVQDCQRLNHDAFRGYFSPPKHIDTDQSIGAGRVFDSIRYISPENLKLEPERYSVAIPHYRNSIGENFRLENEASPNMMAENLRADVVDASQSVISENLRPLDVHLMVPENLRAQTPHSNMPDNLQIGANATSSLMIEDLRVTSEETSRMVPENLCLSESSHQAAMPESTLLNHKVLSHSRPTVCSHHEVTSDRVLNGSLSSVSSIPLFRSQFDASSRIIPQSPNEIREVMKVQSPHYSDIYRNDPHCSISPSAPSIPSMSEQTNTPISHYYTTSYAAHINPLTHSGHPHSFSSYMNDNYEREMRTMSLEEKIERGFHDIKPFDQAYPGTVPMIHASQDVLLPPLSNPSPSVLPKPPKPRKPKEPKSPRMPIIHKCDECLRVFKNSTQLKNHMWRHTGEKPFTCDECGSKFTQQGNLRAHRRIHTGERPYECNDCKASFTQLSTLKTHQKIHTNERPYKCKDCDAAFRQIANLKTHLVTHTGERPHICDQCDKAFTQKSNLKAHKNRVHSSQGVSIPARRGRKKNPAVIKSFSCLECGAKFTVLSNLKIHLKLHAGNKPFECDHCGANFAQRSNLKTHVQRMHGSLPAGTKRRIRCDECPAMFRLRRCLKSHKKRRHPIKSLKIKILGDSKFHMNSSGGSGEEVFEGEGENEEDEDLDDEDDIEGDDDLEEDVYDPIFIKAEESIGAYQSNNIETHGLPSQPCTNSCGSEVPLNSYFPDTALLPESEIKTEVSSNETAINTHNGTRKDDSYAFTSNSEALCSPLPPNPTEN